MFDTMTMTKALGGFCGALLVFLLGGWAADSIYGGGEGGHGEEHAQGYKIEVADAGEAAAPAEEGPSFAEVFATADAAAGEAVFRKCASCHSLAGDNKTGPHLDGVVGRAIDSVDGFGYSGALLQVGDVWTPEALDHFLTKPSAAAPGTKMSFAGLNKVQDRANLIAYLQTQGG